MITKECTLFTNQIPTYLFDIRFVINELRHEFVYISKCKQTSKSHRTSSSSETFGLEIHEKTDAKKGQEQQLDPDCKRKKMTTLKTNNYLTEF